MTSVSDDPRFDRFRDYLLILARMQMGRQVREKFDPSDVVQQTLMDAHRTRDQFRGQTEAELTAWLRQILAHRIADAARNLGRDKRAAHREFSLETDLDASSRRLEAWLAAEVSSPSAKVQHREMIGRLSEAIARLPAEQRDVLILRHLQGKSLLDIARLLGRTERSVAGLLQRGLARLREILHA